MPLRRPPRSPRRSRSRRPRLRRGWRRAPRRAPPAVGGRVPRAAAVAVAVADAARRRGSRARRRANAWCSMRSPSVRAVYCAATPSVSCRETVAWYQFSGTYTTPPGRRALEHRRAARGIKRSASRATRAARRSRRSPGSPRAGASRRTSRIEFDDERIPPVAVRVERRVRVGARRRQEGDAHRRARRRRVCTPSFLVVGIVGRAAARERRVDATGLSASRAAGPPRRSDCGRTGTATRSTPPRPRARAAGLRTNAPSCVAFVPSPRFSTSACDRPTLTRARRAVARAPARQRCHAGHVASTARAHDGPREAARSLNARTLTFTYSACSTTTAMTASRSHPLAHPSHRAEGRWAGQVNVCHPSASAGGRQVAIFSEVREAREQRHGACYDVGVRRLSAIQERVLPPRERKDDR